MAVSIRPSWSERLINRIHPWIVNWYFVITGAVFLVVMAVLFGKTSP